MSGCYICTADTGSTKRIGDVTWYLCRNCDKNQANHDLLVADGPLTKLDAFGDLGVLPEWMQSAQFRLLESLTLDMVIDPSALVRLNDKSEAIIDLMAVGKKIKQTIALHDLVRWNLDVVADQDCCLQLGKFAALPNIDLWRSANAHVQNVLETTTISSSFF